MNCWKVLGIEATSDLAVIKKRYAELIKLYRPDTHPEKFQSIRDAFDAAKKIAAIADSGQSKTQEKLKPTIHIPQEIRHEETRRQPPDIEEKPKPRRNVSETARKILDHILAKLSPGDSSEAIARFESMLLHETLLDLEIRFQFEHWCMQAATNWDPTDEYPGELFDHIGKYFGWDKKGNQYPFIAEHLPRYYSRMDSWKKWQTLISLSGRKKRWTIQRADPYEVLLAKLLTGKLQKISFWLTLLLRGNLKKKIDNYLKNIEDTNPSAFRFEFNTPAVKWWREHGKIYSMPAFYFYPLIILWLMIFAIFDKYVTYNAGFRILLFLLIELVFAWLIMYGVAFAIHKTFIHVRNWLQPAELKWAIFKNTISEQFAPFKKWIIPPVVITSFLLPIFSKQDYSSAGMWLVVLSSYFLLTKDVFMLRGFASAASVLTVDIVASFMGIPHDILKGWSGYAVPFLGAYLGYSSFEYVRNHLPKRIHAAYDKYTYLPLAIMALMSVIGTIIILPVCNFIIHWH